MIKGHEMELVLQCPHKSRIGWTIVQRWKLIGPRMFNFYEEINWQK